LPPDDDTRPLATSARRGDRKNWALTMWAVVPVKSFDRAKSRLATVLSAAERSVLAETMVAHVLGVLSSARGIDGTIVVTDDGSVSALARRFGSRVVGDGASEGHTAAVMAGAKALARDGEPSFLTVPGDVPLLTGADIEAVLASQGQAPAMTIVPSHDRRGSNCVACSPPGCVPLRFGNDSFYPHLEAARAAGIVPTVVVRPNLALDIDGPSDLAALIDQPVPAGLRDLLTDWRVEERVARFLGAYREPSLAGRG
jgi:2-phospho-L-lactate guanylyltransferase